MPRLIKVSYDPTFARPNTWILHPSGIGVRIRFNAYRNGVKGEMVQDVAVRYLRTRAACAPDRVFFRPLDDAGTQWASEDHIFGAPVGCAEIVLERCPPSVAGVLRQF